MKLLGWNLGEAVIQLYQVLGLATLLDPEGVYIGSDLLCGELPILCKEIPRYTASIVHVDDV